MQQPIPGTRQPRAQPFVGPVTHCRLNRLKFPDAKIALAYNTYRQDAHVLQCLGWLWEWVDCSIMRTKSSAEQSDLDSQILGA